MAIPPPFRSAWRNSGLRVISLQHYQHHGPGTLRTIRPAHNHWGLHLFVQGESQLHLPSGDITLGPGQALLSRPEEGYTQDIAEHHPPSHWLSADFELLTLPGFEDPLRRLPQPTLVSGIEPQQIQTWFARIPPADLAERSLRLRPILDSILSELIYLGFTSGQWQLSSGAMPRWLSDLRQVLGQSTVIHDPTLNMATVLRLAGVGRSQLCQAFQQHLGCSPMQWIRRERMTNACRLLRNCDGRSIAGIASACGYRSLPLFSRHFQQAMGCSASAWRKAVGGGHREL